MSWKEIVSQTISEEPDRLGHRLQALVAHGHHRDVRLDRREGVVGRLRPRFRERVEERGLAGVGHADDADPGAHEPEPVRRAAPGGFVTCGPRAAPAGT